MNERGQHALIQAQLHGVKQITEMLSDGNGGFCAGGILLRELGMLDDFGGIGSAIFSFGTTSEAFGMTETEWGRMVYMNNTLKYDFIKIARELPDTED